MSEVEAMQKREGSQIVFYSWSTSHGFHWVIDLSLEREFPGAISLEGHKLSPFHLGRGVFVAFCDFSKAFDKISHHGLFIKLMDRNVPLCFVLIVMFWNMNMEYDCKWRKIFRNLWY